MTEGVWSVSNSSNGQVASSASNARSGPRKIDAAVREGRARSSQVRIMRLRRSLILSFDDSVPSWNEPNSLSQGISSEP